MSAVVQGKWKMIRAWDGQIRSEEHHKIDDRDMLFDLSIDPGEFHNLNNTSPESTAKTDELAADLDAYLTEVDAWTPKDNQDAYEADNGVTFEAEKHKSNDEYSLFEGTRPSNSALKDLDKSPTAHWFENWGVDIGDASNDFEGDGLTNLMKYILRTDPTVADTENNRVLPRMVTSDEGLEFQFTTRYNPGAASVTAQYKQTLTDDWEAIDATTKDSGALLQTESVPVPAGDTGFFASRSQLLRSNSHS
jgi:hypothetical protein